MLANENYIITGSKDHYIKIFELINNQLGQANLNSTNNNLTINSKYNLTPPHYDGVQSLCRFGDYLFSCSRDMCIKKWSMNDFQCKQSINNAHKDWICSLDFLSSNSSSSIGAHHHHNHNNDILLSGCRGGYLKFWNINTLEKIADFKAHLCPINSIKVNKNMIFTASE